MALTTVEEAIAPEVARELLTRSCQGSLSEAVSRTIIDMVTTIMVYKFTSLSRQEIEAMLGLNLQETRFYQEAKAEGEQIGEQRGIEQGEKIGEQRGFERERVLVLRLLTRKVGDIPQELRSQVEQLSLTQLEALGEALLDFSTHQDLIAWLEGDRAES